MPKIYCWVHTDRLDEVSLNKLVSQDICDDVFLLVITSYHVFYNSRIYPSKAIHIPLKEVVNVLRGSGINVHAWIVTLLRSNEEFMFRNLDLYHVSKYGRLIILNPPYRKDYTWLDPANPGTVDHVVNVVNEILDLGLFDSIHLDYIRYPDNPPAPGVAKYYGVMPTYIDEYDFGYSTIALSRFRNEYGLDPKTLDYNSIGYRIWSLWRASRVKDVVNEVKRLCRSRGIKVGADVFPTPEIGFKHVLQKWDEWGIDLYAPMLYHEYWVKSPEWIIQTSLELLSRGLPITPGIHLNQLRIDDVKYVITSLIERIKTLALFTYPPASKVMEENWGTVYALLKDLGVR